MTSDDERKASAPRATLASHLKDLSRKGYSPDGFLDKNIERALPGHATSFYLSVAGVTDEAVLEHAARVICSTLNEIMTAEEKRVAAAISHAQVQIANLAMLL